ncbi:hypothetical protein SVIO_068760 [Streptomyces violaceusniger]|uniref:Uncharacterized protein n=1 Tax=Streptomyces violaceusniger TaxID=68280 RepID=A0A4D4LDT5_STRVO|nr:hypothetical protein SVIO_068760 [Streptomyces violaceusniger]
MAATPATSTLSHAPTQADNSPAPVTSIAPRLSGADELARDGIVTARRAMVTVLAGEKSDTHGLGQAWPPCQCPRHREHNNPNRFKRS